VKKIKLISYNVNGIRAAIKKGFDEWVRNTQFDIYCLQETKAHQEQVDCDWIEQLGYHQFWFSAEKKGYSSVAVFTKKKPQKVIYGMGKKMFDSEGRSILLIFKNYALLNVYFPSGSSGEERSGFLPEERAWMSKYLEAGFIDTFRYFNEEPNQYSWWSYRANARTNNKGWRIDYFITSNELEKHLIDADILPEVKHSDHCPLYLEVKI